MTISVDGVTGWFGGLDRGVMCGCRGSDRRATELLARVPCSIRDPCTIDISLGGPWL